jgi:hypothetical protein
MLSLSRLARRAFAVGACALVLGLPATTSFAAPHCNPRQDNAACDPANLPPPMPPAPAPTPITTIPSNPNAPNLPPSINLNGSPIQLVANGGFESFFSNWFFTSPDPWVLSGGGVTYERNGALAHGGEGYLSFGVGTDLPGTAVQTLTIPANSQEADLSFWLLIQPLPDAPLANRTDGFGVDVLDTHSRLLRRAGFYTNLSPIANGGWSLQGPCDLSAFQGQTIQLRFQASYSRANPTEFRLDDVSVLEPNLPSLRHSPAC